MSLSPIKQEILETMLLNGKPQKAIDIAKEAKKEYQPVNMHLLGLIKMGYVAMPEKGLYAITEKGKRATWYTGNNQRKGRRNTGLRTT